MEDIFHAIYVSSGSDYKLMYHVYLLQLCEFYKGRGEFYDAVLASLATKDLYSNNRKSTDIKSSDLRRNCTKETRREEEPCESKNE